MAYIIQCVLYVCILNVQYLLSAVTGAAVITPQLAQGSVIHILS